MNRRRISNAPQTGMWAAAALVAIHGNLSASDLAIDLSQLGTVHAGFRIDGVATFDRVGDCVSGGGDINGDGVADILVGAPWADSAQANVGKVYAVFGKQDTGAVNLGSLGAGGFEVEGFEVLANLGEKLSGAGDVDGDGLGDLLIAAPFKEVQGVGTGGECYVVYGSKDSATVRLGALGGRGFVIGGARRGDSLGTGVSGAGDVNGDGLADIVAGAPGLGGIPGTGGVPGGAGYLVFGETAGTDINTHNLAGSGFRIGGAPDLSYLGNTVSGAGDVNADGYADLLLAAPGTAIDGKWSVGRSWIVFGSSSGANVDVGNLASGGFHIDGITAGEGSGASASGVGDVNGDGYADVVVSTIWPNSGAGASYVVFGKPDVAPVELSSLANRGFRIDGAVPGDYSGVCVSGAGDVNGDGLADILVGSARSDPNGRVDAGTAFVVFGKADDGSVSLANLGAAGFSIQGAVSGDVAANNLSGVGDINQDGLADIAVAAPGGDAPGLANTGQCYIVFSPMPIPDFATDKATYRAHARSGNAPPLPVGICGDGSDDDSPSSRCWIDFDGGFGPGNKQSSLQTVTLTRNDAGIRILKPERLADVQWRVQTDRVGWRKTRITLKYTDAEIAGLREDTLRVWQASSPRGPWALYSAGMVREPQRNRVSVVVPRLGYFVIEGEPAVP